MVLMIWIVCAFACAAVANSKGRSAVGWFIMGFLFSVFALFVVAVLPKRAKVVIARDERGQLRKVKVKYAVERKCPFCAEYIHAEAVKCRFCQSDVNVAVPTASTVSAQAS